jgi:hypothetical protein
MTAYTAEPASPSHDGLALLTSWGASAHDKEPATAQITEPPSKRWVASMPQLRSFGRLLPSRTRVPAQRFWCGRLLVCPNEMVPLQIDRAVGV